MAKTKIRVGYFPNIARAQRLVAQALSRQKKAGFWSQRSLSSGSSTMPGQQAPWRPPARTHRSRAQAADVFRKACPKSLHMRGGLPVAGDDIERGVRLDETDPVEPHIRGDVAATSVVVSTIAGKAAARNASATQISASQYFAVLVAAIIPCQSTGKNLARYNHLGARPDCSHVFYVYTNRVTKMGSFQLPSVSSGTQRKFFDAVDGA